MDEHTATEQAYKNGYEKGYADAKAELVRCKDCKYFTRDCGVFYCDYHTSNAADCGEGYCDGACYVSGYDFCSYGERKDNG